MKDKYEYILCLACNGKGKFKRTKIKHFKDELIYNDVIKSKHPDNIMTVKSIAKNHGVARGTVYNAVKRHQAKLDELN